MRFRNIMIAAVLGIVAAISTVALAATTISPANAPQGTHLQSGAIGCTVTGLNVSCSTFELAGVGHINATAELDATYSGTVVCRNSGGNLSDGQHQGSFDTSTGPVPLTSDKNGRLTVPSLSASAPSEQDFIAQQTCPNPNWTPELSGAITLSSFTYTLTFEGFTGAYITITGP